MGGVKVSSISCKSNNPNRPRKDFPCSLCGSNANGACSLCGILCKKCICTYYIDGEEMDKEEEQRKLDVRRKKQKELPALYYACPTGQSLDGRSWGNPTTCLITDTGLTIMDVLDENMEDLLYLNRVSIASEIKDLLLQHLDIDSIWNTNINGK